MAYKSFLEYLDGKSKLHNTGKVQDVADYDGPIPTKPGKEKKHKDAGGEGQKGDPKPYAGGTNAADPNKGKLKDGFAGKGEKSLEYNPGKKGKNKAGKASNSSGVPGGKVVASTWNKTKTQEWLDRTRGLSLAEFTKHLQKKTTANINLDECACQNPLEVVKQTVALAKANESVMLSLIQELKRNKAFGKFMGEALQHDYTYAVIAKFMESDEKYARRLVRAMNEMVGPPAHGDEGMDDDPSTPPHPDEMHGSDDDELGLGDDLEGKPGKESPMDGPELDDDDEDEEDDEFDFESDPTEMGGDGEDGPDPSDGPHGKHGDPDSDIAPGSKIMPQKKKHAHHHLMSALQDSPMGGGGLGGSMVGMGGI